MYTLDTFLKALNLVIFCDYKEIMFLNEMVFLQILMIIFIIMIFCCLLSFNQE